jgi:hypothetical protein
VRAGSAPPAVAAGTAAASPAIAAQAMAFNRVYRLALDLVLVLVMAAPFMSETLAAAGRP